jgi:hypothetical protein
MPFNVFTCAPAVITAKQHTTKNKNFLTNIILATKLALFINISTTD